MKNAQGAILVMTMLLGACGGSTDAPEPTPEQAQESSVSVTLADYSIVAEPGSVPAGEVTFDVTNEGGFHDLYVLRTDLPASDLPEHEELMGEEQVTAFKVDLQAPELEDVGSIDVLEEGATESLTLELESGHYALICDLVNFEEVGGAAQDAGSHYSLGMRADFTVG